MNPATLTPLCEPIESIESAATRTGVPACVHVQALAAASGGICAPGYCQLPPCPLPMPRLNDPAWAMTGDRVNYVNAFRLIVSPIWRVNLTIGGQAKAWSKQWQEQQQHSQNSAGSSVTNDATSGAGYGAANSSGGAGGFSAVAVPCAPPGAAGRQKGRRQRQPHSGAAAMQPPPRADVDTGSVFALFEPSQVRYKPYARGLLSPMHIRLL